MAGVGSGQGYAHTCATRLLLGRADGVHPQAMLTQMPRQIDGALIITHPQHLGSGIGRFQRQ